MPSRIMITNCVCHLLAANSLKHRLLCNVAAIYYSHRWTAILQPQVDSYIVATGGQLYSHRWTAI